MKHTESKYQGMISALILFVSLFAIALHVGNYTVFTLPSIQFYAYHVMIGLILVFLYYPLDVHGARGKTSLVALCRIIDWIIIAMVLIISLYVILNFQEYSQNMQNNIITDEIFYFGLILSLIVLEASRRVLGIILPIIAILAVIYALVGNSIPGLFGNRGYSLHRIVLALFSDRGIYGVPTGTSASNVYLFLMFAAYLNASGADVIFQNIAIALAGKKRGGPAKMAVIASALFGTISGSCVANVVSTGAFTIPLMKRNGYPKATAGAIEAVASTGGQIMPPIMGAAAFVLADVAGIPYATVCIGAVIPAMMYYICLFKMVDLEAVRYQLKGLDAADLPDLKDSLARGMKLFIPVIVLLVLLLGFKTTPMTAAIYSTLTIIICGLLDSKERLTGQGVLKGAVGAGKSLCTVLSACATSGIVVGIFSLTGLGLKFSNFIVQMGNSSLAISLVLSMIVCAILGMGLPTTAAYIVCATAIAPALVKLGLPLLSAHLFLLYFASISAITPPVAVASYAASGIAEENPMKVSWKAFSLGITGFILPFAFAFNPEYLSIGFDFTTLVTLISAVVVAMSVAICLQGIVEERISIFERLAYFAIACVAITPNQGASLLASLCFLVIYSVRKIQAKRKKTVTALAG
ncbi:TRAP transporter, 4TM/12TM fusion protein [Sphaerochaeta pleomorpha str. Grapes]|uniref:TRAP transporter, 4TM/12TM fusion protein n=1 Tax=Sphaerochaeta pleomorpha (strain ATCC BAA-1885 / DSM 22778 / Grapes) TaxID=158190 RepID=G8QWZ6_SPHPG|nr:TRAP transporter fused permease subunit [Sphaerochaeta pleomorpha]AEV29500.1 TRAP transporter, 4TM/12TM fusion protein [Sphaerochaeta pleomorpha str. Grapes]